MPSYAQWFVNATGQAATEAHARMMREGGGTFYLYFKRNGLEFKVIREDEDASGFELVMNERIPAHFTLPQLSRLFSEKCGRVEVLPLEGGR